MRDRLLDQSPVGPEPAGHESSGAAASRLAVVIHLVGDVRREVKAPRPAAS
jgi:hypothetical protein